MSQPLHMHTFCNQLSDNFTQTSSYKSNRETLLSSLRDLSSLGTYSNVTIGLSPDTVHGMFLCRGDITKTSCSVCVKTATQEVAKNCTYQKEAIIYYEECMVRYSDISFLVLVDSAPYVAKYSNVSFTSLLFAFRLVLSDKVEQLIILTASKSSLSSSTPYYIKDRKQVNQLESYWLDTMVQCSPDLDPKNCGLCLRLAVKEMTECCNNARWAHIFLPKCLLKYDTTGSQSGSSSMSVMKGNEMFGRMFITVMTTLVLALVGL
ncbi:hypothetical protein EUTSA_v10028048mg [Eutrema salsugineum]|uniref:Gnk2-homologous domain-containing protein n=2 Tax=Eutrema salsugineum TaxID=72664 RepID=V4LAJ0_EUTSA|nr:hypothetical protein EUTSA_v10028048mg [Eutrema salsugineum]